MYIMNPVRSPARRPKADESRGPRRATSYGMNTSFKPLVWAGSAVLVILAVFLLAETNQVVNTAATTNTVSFSGEGKISAVPDIATISATVLTQAADTKVAQDDNAKKSNAVTDFLKKQGIADKDIKTSGYNIYPQYSYPRPCPLNSTFPCVENQQQITSYQVIQSFDIKVRDLTKIGTLLSGLVSAGANQVNNLGLQIENPDALKSQARQLAIDDAKKKATELESQVGIRLGRIVNFSENTGGYYPQPMAFEAKGLGGGAAAPDISPGQNDITVDVSITYQIK